MNTKHNADIVITKALVGWTIWMNDDVVANANWRSALDLIVAGASACKKSVYDAEAGHFLVGTVAELMGEA